MSSASAVQTAAHAASVDAIGAATPTACHEYCCNKSMRRRNEIMPNAAFVDKPIFMPPYDG